MWDMAEDMHFAAQEHFICGVVKWYSPKCGYGFIVDQDTGADVFLAAEELRDFGWETIAQGAVVVAWAKSTERGLKIYAISYVTVPSDIEERRIFDFQELDYISSDYVPARVTWYDEEKGYGFASTYGDEEACFLHYKALAEAGLRHLNPGDVISVRIGRNSRGRVAACIRSGESQPLPTTAPAEILPFVAA